MCLCFNPRTPRGVRHLCYPVVNYFFGFNPRTPRGVRRLARVTRTLNGVSIHAPLAGCDSLLILAFVSDHCFNPRTPRGVRPIFGIVDEAENEFQSTHPSRGATDIPFRRQMPPRVSIHAPLAGCDMEDRLFLNPVASFNPRTPRGVRPSFVSQFLSVSLFQSTHPSRGATLQGFRHALQVRRFNPRTPRGVRPLWRWQASMECMFQSTHPSRGATVRRIYI